MLRFVPEPAPTERESGQSQDVERMRQLLAVTGAESVTSRAARAVLGRRNLLAAGIAAFLFALFGHPYAEERLSAVVGERALAGMALLWLAFLLAALVVAFINDSLEGVTKRMQAFNNHELVARFRAR